MVIKDFVFEVSSKRSESFTSDLILNASLAKEWLWLLHFNALGLSRSGFELVTFEFYHKGEFFSRTTSNIYEFVVEETCIPENFHDLHHVMVMRSEEILFMHGENAKYLHTWC